VEDNVTLSLSNAARGRAWLAALLLQRQSRLMPRFTLALARLRALPRGQRQRLKRQAASTLAGAALVLAIGAANFGPPGAGVAHAATITVNETTCTLIDAIRSANANAAVGGCVSGAAGLDTIELAADVTLTASYADYQGETGLPAVSSQIVINGNGRTIARDGGADPFRLFFVDSSGDLTFNNVSLTGGYSDTYTFTGPPYYYYYGPRGGAVFVDEGKLTINGSTVTHNRATVVSYSGPYYTSYNGQGGAVFSRGGDVTISNSTFTYNASGDDGAAVTVDQLSTLSVRDSTFTDNASLSNDAGAIKISESEATISGSTFSRNSADSQGGAIYSEEESSLTIEGTLIDNNYAGTGGGGLYAGETNLTVTDSTISNNTSRDGEGGGVYVADGQSYISYGVYATYRVEISRTTISGNRSESDAGGGLYIAAIDVTIRGSTISDNYALGAGGGIYVTDENDQDTTLTIVNSTISGNDALGHGGGIYAESKGDNMNVVLTHVTVTDNYTQLDGGGLHLYGRYSDVSADLSRTLVSGNSAGSDSQEINVRAVAGYGTASITAAAYNVFSDAGKTSGDAFTGFTPGASDVDASSDAANYALGAILSPTLANNGGPTLTHALVSGSPAVDIAPDGETTDQRGAPRPFGNAYDAGAFEYGATPPTGDSAIFVTAAGGSVPGVGPYKKGDILKWHGASWTKWFSSAALGLNPLADLTAFDVADDGDGSAWLVWRQRLPVPGAGKPTGNDITFYDGASFSVFFDGSDVGLSTAGERIDGLEVRPGSPGCDYDLLISTVAGGAVRNGLSAPIKFTGEDVLRFCLTAGGGTTAGSWQLLEELQSEGLARNNSLDIAADDSGDVIYFLPKVKFTLDASTVKPSEIAAFDRVSRTFSGPLWKAADHGLMQVVDGIEVRGALP